MIKEEKDEDSSVASGKHGLEKLKQSHNVSSSQYTQKQGRFSQEV